VGASSAHILLAEDDPKQRSLIGLYLERDGHRVSAVADGRSALELARAQRPDLAVLDVMMPDLDGLELCRILRGESDLAIVLLTARSTKSDLLLGLDLGADDYVTKPFSPQELTMRVRALLRRSRSEAYLPVRQVGALEVDTLHVEARVNGAPVALTRREFDILNLLTGHPGRVFSRGQILARVFGHDTDVLERTVDVHVRNLRRKLGTQAGGDELVETMYGRGYRVGSGEQ
jgi:DNA-binding response OmpR family regulator